MSKVYQIITDRIIKLMDENNSLIWVKDWTGNKENGPRNLISKRPYTGINFLLLSHLPFSENLYLTFNQVKQLGGNVIKGSEGIPVIFWKINQYEKENSAGTLESKQAAMLRYYTVFNVEQCEGLNYEKAAEIQPLNDHETIEAAENIISNMPLRPEIIKYSGDRAYYSRLHDSIHIPEINFFRTQAGYYSTLFHEIGHSTGHKNRLGRKELETISFFGDTDYSREELTAELTAAYVCAEIGISNQDSIKNSAAYLQGWKKALRNDPQAFISASSKAQKAAEYILNRKQVAESEAN